MDGCLCDIILNARRIRALLATADLLRTNSHMPTRAQNDELAEDLIGAAAVLACLIEYHEDMAAIDGPHPAQ